MTTGQVLNRIDAQLIQLRACIRQTRLDLDTEGASRQPDAPGHHAFWQKLAGYGERLRMILHGDLKSIDSLLGVHSQAVWKLPRFDPRGPGGGGSPRYRERARIDSHRQRLREVYRNAAEVEAMLRDLYFEGQRPTNAEVVEHVHEILKEFEASRVELKASTAVGPQGHSFQPPVGAGEPSAPLSTLLTIILAYILKRTRR